MSVEVKQLEEYNIALVRHMESVDNAPALINLGQQSHHIAAEIAAKCDPKDIMRLIDSLPEKDRRYWAMAFIGKVMADGQAFDDDAANAAKA